MSLFRKQPQTGAPTTSDEDRASQPTPASTPTPAPTQASFDGARVDIDAVYKAAKLPPEELDRVTRAEGLLHLLPTTAPHTREVVDATLRAFGVDRVKIVTAASRQLETLESFIRSSHDHTQRAQDAGAKRIAELEAEIERCRQVAAQATREGEERARTVNDVLVKVQRVLDFFGDDKKALPIDLDDDTTIARKADDAKPSSGQPSQPPKPTSRTTP